MNFWSAWEAFFVFGSLFLVANLLAKRFSLLTGILSFWVLFSAFRIFTVGISPYRNESAQWNLVFERATGLELFHLTVYALAIFTFSLRAWTYFFQGAAIINILSILIGTSYGKPYGVLLNASMSGCFLVATLPLFFKGESFPVLSILGSVLAVILTHQSLPLACLFFLLWTVCIKAGEWALVGLLPLFAVAMGYFLVGEDLFKTSGRMQLWADSWHWFLAQSSGLLGAGLGSYSVIGPYLTQKLPEQFPWLHSDWFQILFELGALGLASALLFFAESLDRAYKNPQCYFSLLVYGAWMVANMPCHYPLSALYGLFLIRWAFSGDNSRMGRSDDFSLLHFFFQIFRKKQKSAYAFTQSNAFVRSQKNNN